MCVWQSQAPAGTLKLTSVAGCEAVANARVDPCPYRRVANPPAINSRRPTFLLNLLLVDAIEVIQKHSIWCLILIGGRGAFQLDPTAWLTGKPEIWELSLPEHPRKKSLKLRRPVSVLSQSLAACQTSIPGRSPAPRFCLVSSQHSKQKIFFLGVWQTHAKDRLHCAQSW